VIKERNKLERQNKLTKTFKESPVLLFLCETGPDMLDIYNTIYEDIEMYNVKTHYKNEERTKIEVLRRDNPDTIITTTHLVRLYSIRAYFSFKKLGKVSDIIVPTKNYHSNADLRNAISYIKNNSKIYNLDTKIHYYLLPKKDGIQQVMDILKIDELAVRNNEK
jgi:uncharacterized protein YegP (UPF0339 family)